MAEMKELFPEILNVNRIAMFFKYQWKAWIYERLFYGVHHSSSIHGLHDIFWIVLCNNIQSSTKGGGMFLQTISQKHQELQRNQNSIVEV